MSWHTGRLAAFDIETTGVNPESDRIVTAAVSIVGGDLPADQHSWLVSPGIDIPLGATRVHGITSEQARAAGSNPAEAIDEITAVLTTQLLNGVPVVAFNARFDLTILDREARRHGLPPLLDRVGGPDEMLVVDPHVLDKHFDRYGLNPEVTVGADGDAIAAWEGRSGVEAAIRQVGGGWLAPQTVGTPRGEDPQEPQVASDASGGAIVVAPLQGHGRGSAGIQAAVRPAGGTFSPPQMISHHHEKALDPRIAMNSRGDAIVAWDVQVPKGCLVRAAFRSARGAWGAPRTVPGGHEFCRGNHRVAIDERGNAILAWVAMRSSTMLVKTARRDAKGRWSAQPVIGRASSIAEPPGPVQVGMDARGDAIVVWMDPALVLGGRRTIWARVRPVGRGWGAKERIADVTYESSPSFAMNARGDASVVWEDKRGVEVASDPAGGGWQTPNTVSGRTSAEIAFQAAPVVALDARGDGMIAWQSNQNIKTAWHAPPFP